MAYFAAVADGGGFGATSRALGIPKATLSRRVARLEASLGVDLLVRDEQRLYLTPLGAAFAGHCAAVLREARRAMSVVGPLTQELQGTLRVACPAALLGSTLAEPLRAFVAKHLRVSLLLIVTDSADDDAIDLALGVDPIAHHADARLLREEPSVLVAAPVLARELERVLTDRQGPTETLWLRFTRSHPPCALALALAEALGEQLATCRCL